MNISENGLNLIKKFESCRLTAYHDPIGVLTIGWGHTGNVRAGETITQAQADQLLKNDVNHFVDAVNSYVKVKLNQNQFDALVSFTYNVGKTALKTSTLLEYLNKGDFVKASKEFDLWIHAGGKVLQGLVNRRNAEQALFNKPVSSVKPSTHSIKSLGKIKVDKLKNYTYIYEKPNDSSKHLGTAIKNSIYDIAGSVPDWYEIIFKHNGKEIRAYIKDDYCSKI